MFRGRRFIDLNTTASKNELTSHMINWRIFVYIYPRTNSTKLWRISCAAPATLPPLAGASGHRYSGGRLRPPTPPLGEAVGLPLLGGWAGCTGLRGNRPGGGSRQQLHGGSEGCTKSARPASKRRGPRKGAEGHTRGGNGRTEAARAAQRQRGQREGRQRPHGGSKGCT